MQNNAVMVQSKTNLFFSQKGKPGHIVFPFPENSYMPYFQVFLNITELAPHQPRDNEKLRMTKTAAVQQPFDYLMVDVGNNQICRIMDKIFCGTLNHPDYMAQPVQSDIFDRGLHTKGINVDSQSTFSAKESGCQGQNTGPGAQIQDPFERALFFGN
jgi:hypothetical protein